MQSAAAGIEAADTGNALARADPGTAIRRSRRDVGNYVPNIDIHGVWGYNFATVGRLREVGVTLNLDF